MFWDRSWGRNFVRAPKGTVQSLSANYMYLSGWLSPSPRRLQIQIRHHVLHFVRIDDLMQLLGVRPHLRHHVFRLTTHIRRRPHTSAWCDRILCNLEAVTSLSAVHPTTSPGATCRVRDTLRSHTSRCEHRQKQNFPSSEADQAGEASQASSSESCPEAFT